MRTRIASDYNWISFGQSPMKDNEGAYRATTDPPFLPLFAFFLWSNSVLREADASTESQRATSISKPNLVPLAVGLTFGLVSVVIVVFCGACYLYRRRRTLGTPIDPDLNANHVSPYTPDQQLNWSQDRKHRPQITRQFDVAMDTRPFAFSELGPPPSYRSDHNNRGMGTSD